MSRQEKRIEQRAQNKSQALAADRSSTKVDIFLVLLYLITDLIPQFGAIDPMGSQWLYLSVLNLIITVYILAAFRGRLSAVVDRFSKNAVAISVFLFFILSGVSIIFAINQVESMVVYSRLITTVIAFCNIFVLISNRPKSIQFLLQALTIITLIECVPILTAFLKGLGTAPIDTLVSNMKSSAGNKNVLAASLVIKVPFIIYCAISYYSFWRYLLNIVTLLIVVSMIFILNARASYLGLFVQIAMLLTFVVFYRKYTSRQQLFKQIASVVVPVIFGAVVSQILIKTNEDIFASGTYTTLDKRLATLSDHSESSANARLFFWKNAIKQIKETPITGVGYGNWKIASVKYEYGFYNDFNYSKHAHNDFLQVTAEAGIQTGLAFLSIFVIALIYVIRTWRSKNDIIFKTLVTIAFISLAGYAVDASFNFPAERPTMQILFSFILAIIASIGMPAVTAERTSLKNSLGLVLPASVSIILILISIYLSYYTFRSMIVQAKTHFTFGTVNRNVTWQDVNPKLPDIPNLAENNIPINDTKAWYLYTAQRYDEALSLLNQDKNANPYSMSKEWLKSMIFVTQGKVDSAHFYAKKGFFQRPRNLSLFNLISRTSVPLNDTLTIQRAFREYHKYREEPHAWKIYMRSLFAVNYNQAQLIRTADSIAAIYPNDAEVQHTRFFIRAGYAAIRKDFSESLQNLLGIMKIYPNDYENLENIGLTYYYMKDYQNAAVYFKKVTDAKAYGNGKSEFFLGNCLLQLGRKVEACGYLSTAANKNYPMAAIIFNKNNCELQASSF